MEGWICENPRIRRVLLPNSQTSLVDIHPADAFVCTACPRIAIDDALRYKKPMLTPPELETVLGVRPWEKYEFDQFFWLSIRFVS